MTCELTGTIDRLMLKIKKGRYRNTTRFYLIHYLKCHVELIKSHAKVSKGRDRQQ
jgi:hypothetical protein